MPPPPPLLQHPSQRLELHQILQHPFMCGRPHDHVPIASSAGRDSQLPLRDKRMRPVRIYIIIHVHVQYAPKWKCAERTKLEPNRIGLHTIKSVSFRWTSTISCPDSDRTGVGFTSTRLTVFDIHHRSRGLSSLSKFVVTCIL